MVTVFPNEDLLASKCLSCNHLICCTCRFACICYLEQRNPVPTKVSNTFAHLFVKSLFYIVTILSSAHTSVSNGISLSGLSPPSISVPCLKSVFLILLGTYVTFS